ncbi:MAG: thioredoxin domain-containing protein, partial [Candidatus Omnitrophica bacterium]|nr:thioredoxin domain-containing protein [Candidatus Omnitrophota bacterium]
PCKMLSPVIDELEKEYQGKVKFCKINIDDAHDIAGKYSIMSIPTLMVFKKGKKCEQLVGFVPKEHIRQMLDEII